MDIIINFYLDIPKLVKREGEPMYNTVLDPACSRTVKHPESHQIACCIDDKTGRVQIIIHGKIITLFVPPGEIRVAYGSVLEESRK